MIRQVPVGRFVLLLAAWLPLTGCGGGFGDVSGRVTLDGQPLPAGTITFVDADNITHSDQIQDGKYRVTHVAAGKVRVSVVTPLAIEFVTPGKPKSGGPLGGLKPPAGKGPEVPEKYQDHEKSGLAYDVQRGENTINVEMKSQ
jgi:hypothetical protein